MNTREKKLTFGVGGLVLLITFGFLVKAAVVSPLRQVDRKTANLRVQLHKLRGERQRSFAAEDNLKALTQRTFSDRVDLASAQSGSSLTKQILESGLIESDFSRLPVGPRKLPGGQGAQELGWSVQGKGSLEKVINLLFLLETSPYVHRIENLDVSAADASGQVKVRFRYLTLVINPAPAVDPVELGPFYALDGPERRRYDPLVQRDFLRPYVKPPPAPPREVPPPRKGPGLESLQVVSLSEWNGQPEIHVRDLTLGKTVRYQLGDALAGGEIVLVDYRSLPFPGKEYLRSNSRVIIKIGEAYWAVESGQTLANKHQLAPEQLPEQLSKL